MTAPGRFDTDYHAPVLVDEVCGLLVGHSPVLDGTLGGGGHSAALLEGGARVIGTDRDPVAIATARTRLAAFEADGSFRWVQCNYADVPTHPAFADVQLGGILLDLGVSSHQLDDEARGFSFRDGAPLDMRMAGTDADEPTAADYLNTADELQLHRVFKEFGDEPKASRMAREVVRRRGNRLFATSDDLVGVIRGVLGPRSGPGDFARIFQAVRIAVNDELDGLERALPALRDKLAPGGVFAVIAYHSGEDRLVKHAFREWSRDCICPPKQMMCSCRGHALGTPLTKKAVTATMEELQHNPRSRSARLRAWRAAPVG
jgi:16S rRNA (cytosine1402-N4)-methyltransferase